jgi:hypothetical protein
MELTTDQLGKLLFKCVHEDRRNQKRFLKDCGLQGSASELDRQLQLAQVSHDAQLECRRLERERATKVKTVDAGVDADDVEMLAAIRSRLHQISMTQAELATAAGMKGPLVSDYLTGKK